MTSVIMFSTLCLVLVSIWVSAEASIVNTTYGPVKGSVKTYLTGAKYERFLGIPYGGTTEGANRWKKPTDPVSWTEPLDCRSFAAYCPQITSTLYPLMGISSKNSEDCLFVNVYVPLNTEKGEKLPVMVFFFGGAFLIGNTNMYPGEGLATNAKVIVVSVNYRVGTLGTMSTGDANSPGNMALWDDAKALNWVHDNIANFGGDQNRITIFGQSAGAATVSYLLLSEHTRHLFQRAIGISGSSTAYFANTQFHEESSRGLALLYLCPILSKKRMVDCLKKKSAGGLDIRGILPPVLMGQHLPNWLPVVDGDFISDLPRDLVKAGATSKHDIMMGSTYDDGAGFVLLNIFGMGYKGLLNIAGSKRVMNLAIDLLLNIYSNGEELKKMIFENYPDLDSDDRETRTKAASRVMTEWFFTSPATFEAEEHARLSKETKTRTYLYEYKYALSFQKYPSWVNGSHIDDLNPVFGETFMESFRKTYLRKPWSDDDRKVSTYIQKYYGNFAYTGNPNEGPHEVPTYWPEFDLEKRQYMEQNPVMEVREQSEETIHNMKFWEEFYEKQQRKKTWSVFSLQRESAAMSSVYNDMVGVIENFLSNLEMAEPKDTLNALRTDIEELIARYP